MSFYLTLKIYLPNIHLCGAFYSNRRRDARRSDDVLFNLHGTADNRNAQSFKIYRKFLSTLRPDS